MFPPELIVIGLVIIVIILSMLRITQEYERAVIFRLGRFARIGGPGVYILLPLIESKRIVDIRVVTVPIEQQETITRDSVTIKVNAVVWYRIVKPQRAVIAVRDFQNAVNQVSLTSLRNVIGQHDLDEILRERDKINAMIGKIVDESTETWGVKIEAVEMKDVEIPASMQRAMAQEAEAVREKRARVIKAEADRYGSAKLTEAAQMIAEHPAARELRRMQMVSEVGAEQNSTLVIMMPSDFVNVANSVSRLIEQNLAKPTSGQHRGTAAEQG